MTDEQCIALLATIMRTSVVVCDALTRQDAYGESKVKVEQLTNEQAVELAADIFRKAQQAARNIS